MNVEHKEANTDGLGTKENEELHPDLILRRRDPMRNRTPSPPSSTIPFNHIDIGYAYPF
jgi:hypothetical protein